MHVYHNSSQAPLENRGVLCLKALAALQRRTGVTDRTVRQAAGPGPAERRGGAGGGTAGRSGLQLADVADNMQCVSRSASGLHCGPACMLLGCEPVAPTGFPG